MHIQEELREALKPLIAGSVSGLKSLEFSIPRELHRRALAQFSRIAWSSLGALTHLSLGFVNEAKAPSTAPLAC